MRKCLCKFFILHTHTHSQQPGFWRLGRRKKILVTEKCVRAGWFVCGVFDNSPGDSKLSVKRGNSFEKLV